MTYAEAVKASDYYWVCLIPQHLKSCDCGCHFRYEDRCECGKWRASPSEQERAK